MRRLGLALICSLPWQLRAAGIGNGCGRRCGFQAVRKISAYLVERGRKVYGRERGADLKVNRREFLRGACALAAGALFAPKAKAADSAPQRKDSEVRLQAGEGCQHDLIANPAFVYETLAHVAKQRYGIDIAEVTLIRTECDQVQVAVVTTEGLGWVNFEPTRYRDTPFYTNYVAPGPMLREGYLVYRIVFEAQSAGFHMENGV